MRATTARSLIYAVCSLPGRTTMARSVLQRSVARQRLAGVASPPLQLTCSGGLHRHMGYRSSDGCMLHVRFPGRIFGSHNAHIHWRINGTFPASIKVPAQPDAILLEFTCQMRAHRLLVLHYKSTGETRAWQGDASRWETTVREVARVTLLAGSARIAVGTQVLTLSRVGDVLNYK